MGASDSEHGWGLNCQYTAKEPASRAVTGCSLTGHQVGDNPVSWPLRSVFVKQRGRVTPSPHPRLSFAPAVL